MIEISQLSLYPAKLTVARTLLRFFNAKNPAFEGNKKRFLLRRTAKISGASNRDRTGDLILTMDALYLLSYGSIHQASFKSYQKTLGKYNIIRLTRKAAKQVPIATTRRLFPLHASTSAVINPAAAEITLPVE